MCVCDGCYTASITHFPVCRVPCLEGLLSCFNLLLHLGILNFIFELYIGSEVQGDNRSCMWVEDIHAVWVSTAHIVFIMPHEHRTLMNPHSTDSSKTQSKFKVSMWCLWLSRQRHNSKRPSFLFDPEVLLVTEERQWCSKKHRQPRKLISFLFVLPFC